MKLLYLYEKGVIDRQFFLSCELSQCDLCKSTLRKKNFEKTEEYKRAYGRKDDDRRSDAKGNLNGGQRGEASAQGGYIQRLVGFFPFLHETFPKQTYINIYLHEVFLVDPLLNHRASGKFKQI